MKVFVAAGAYKPSSELYIEEAKKLGRLLADNKFTYVQGGCDKGMMGATYGEFLAKSDDVELIIPLAYQSDIVDMVYKKLHLVDTINERLMLITRICKYIIVIPGGFGTLDEITNFVETSRGKEHNAKLILVNINGFYDNFFKQLEVMEKTGFIIKGLFESIVKVVDNCEEAMKFILEDIKNSRK